jgi:hypothetical protein
VTVAAVELNGQSGVGDGDGEGSSGVGATHSDSLPADRHRSAMIGQALHLDRFLRRAGWRPGRACSAQPLHLLRVERLGRVRSNVRVSRSNSNRVVGSIRILTCRQARIAAPTRIWPPRGTCRPAEMTRSTCTASPGARVRIGASPALRAPATTSLRRSATVKCEATLFTRAPAMDRWITSVLAQNRTVNPARAGPSQN